MKIKEHTRQVRDEDVEKFKAGIGYKTSSQALNMSQSSVQSISWKWKVQHLQTYEATTRNWQGEGSISW